MNAVGQIEGQTDDHANKAGPYSRTPELHLMGKTLEDMISFIEDFTGEKLTPEEIEELRQILANEGSSQSKAG